MTETERNNFFEKEEKKYIIFEIQGGMGKNIMATAVVDALKKQYPDWKIVIVTAWEAPWWHNPNIYRVYTFGYLQYFYDEFVFDNTKIMRIDPYATEDHIQQRKHLVKTWCDLYDIPYNGEKPKLYLNPRELEITRDKLKPDGRPIMLLQTHGGAQGQYSKKSWARDMPTNVIEKLVNYFSKSYRILHIRREDQLAINGVEPLVLPHRELYAAFTLSQKRVFIDSFSQHAAMALGLKSNVFWIANKPEVFGYEENNNIVPKAEVSSEFNKFSYMDKYDITGNIHQYPFDTMDIFDVNEAIQSIRNT